MVIRTVVVDDERPARNELCFLLDQLSDVDLVGQASNGIDAMQAIREQKPDLVLLDIQMPGRTGFEVTRELLLREVDTHIVFVTAYDQYAIEAFEVNAVDYLLKPVEASRLEQSIDRVKARIASTSDDNDIDTLDDQRLERILQQVNRRRMKHEQIAIKIGQGFQLIPSEDIIYASLADDIITVVTSDLTGTSNCRTLDELHSNLDNSFWRVHRSHLVNINKVKEIVPWDSRNYILKMKDSKETEIPVSRAQTKRLREYLSL